MILRKINIISIGCEISQHCKEFVPKKKEIVIMQI